MCDREQSEIDNLKEEMVQLKALLKVQSIRSKN